MKRFYTLILCLAAMLACSHSSVAQSCTVNAGGNATVCGSSATLTGAATGTVSAASPTWIFVSGPTTPVIVSPNSLITNVTGMTSDGNYVFSLSQPCVTGTATSSVTITAHARPASFTAGPDVTNICATTGTTPLAGVIPAGFTGTWRFLNIYYFNRFGLTVTTNGQLSSTSVATPTFSLVNKAGHTIDPSYYTILKITSADGVCSYEDTAIVRFIPNPIINPPVTYDQCISATNPQNYFFLDAEPYFATAVTGAAGTPAAGTTVTLTTVSQPAGGTLSFGSLDNDIVFLNGASIVGTYVFKLTVTNACGTYTTPNITYINNGPAPKLVNFQPTGHTAPEQLTVYSFTGSGGEVHCGIANTSTPETFYFSLDPTQSANNLTTVTPSTIYPPGGAPTVVSVSGAGTYNRSATVNPPAGGWRIGTYLFIVAVSNSNGSCELDQYYYIHISDNSRPALSVADVSVCKTGNGAVTATIALPAIYKGVVNSSYFQDLPAYYNFSVVSKPAGSGTPTYTTTNLRTITTATTPISNLTRAGDYVFTMTFNNGGGVGPFLEQEYSCSGIGTYQTNFTIHVDSLINSNAGSDQTTACGSGSASLVGNSFGTGTGLWSVASAPAGATPVFASPTSPLTTVSHMNVIGTYNLVWTITTANNGCTSKDTVAVTVSCVVPVTLESFTGESHDCNAELSWRTSGEVNFSHFEVEAAADGASFQKIATIAPAQAHAYSYSYKQPGKNAYYRLRLVGKDGTSSYSNIVAVKTKCDGDAVDIYPNPAKDNIVITGLHTGASVRILNAAGLLTEEVKNVTGSSLTVKLKNYPAGVYYVHVFDNNESSVHKIYIGN